MSSSQLPTQLFPRKTEWTEVSPKGSPKTCLVMLNRLYWRGVDRDLDEILHTLNWWRHDAVPTADSTDPMDWLGFEAFVKRATGSESSDSM